MYQLDVPTVYSRTSSERTESSSSTHSEMDFLQTIISHRMDQKHNIIPYTVLIDFCWWQIFDLLPLKTVYDMGLTCKKFKQLCDHYLLKNGFLQSPKSNHYTINFDFENKIKTLTNVYLDTRIIYENHFHHLNPICLVKIKKIKIKFCIIMNINSFFQSLKNDLKTLHIKYCGRLEIFKTSFPLLEEFSYDHRYEEKIIRTDDIQGFFNAHKTLKRFQCTWEFLIINYDAFEMTHHTFEELTIQFGEYDSERGVPRITTAECFNLLTKLHDKKKYKFLNVSFKNTRASFPMGKVAYMQDLCQNLPVKKLYIADSNFNAPSYCFTNHFENIEELKFRILKVFQMFTFVSDAPKLKKLIVKQFENRFDINDLKLIKLNKQRQQLKNAYRISIFLPEEEYLLIKQKYTNTVDLSHITIKRSENLHAISTK